MKPVPAGSIAGALTLILLMMAPLVAAQAAAPPLPSERQLDVHLTLSGPQHWKAGVQSTEGSTKQDYDFSTRLRSNGFLYSDDLLDPDPDARIGIKQQYYARQGLLQLKRENAGRLPQTPAEIDRLNNSKGAVCGDEFECHYRAMERFAAFAALKVNSVAELDEFLASPGNGETPRYQYLFGYAGCPVRIHVTYEAHVGGQRAYNHARDRLVPFSLDRAADSAGSEDDRKTLCEKYVATLDTKAGTLSIENLFLPSAPGTSVRNIDGSVVRETLAMPIPPVVLDWTSARLRKNTQTGSDKTKLENTRPLDGDSTVMGDFSGTLDVGLSWSFKPIAAAPAPR